MEQCQQWKGKIDQSTGTVEEQQLVKFLAAGLKSIASHFAEIEDDQSIRF
jgi:hypothetical protein